ncbi:MAG: hypothetical protein IJO29_01395 [Oscillospiraceae bacterium]|nr:hypothetical protein [Oscillospiraceae bacterium]
MSTENTVKTTLRIDEDLMIDIAKIAKDEGASVTSIVTSALKFYRDYRYMSDKASFINEDIVKLLDSRLALVEQRINTKTNQVLSSTAIELEIVSQILAEQLEISPAQVEIFRRKAVDFIKMNNRAFRLSELID